MITLQQQDAGHWRLEGSLTVASINAVLTTGNKAIRALEAGASVELDCSGLEKIDSASVALLIDWLRIAKRSNVNLTFHNIPEKMQGIIKLSNLASLFA